LSAYRKSLNFRPIKQLPLRVSGKCCVNVEENLPIITGADGGVEFNPQNRLKRRKTNLWNQERIAVNYSRADAGLDNGGIKT